MTNHRPPGRRTPLRLLLGIATVGAAILAAYGVASLLESTPGSDATRARVGLLSPAQAASPDERADYFPAQFTLRASETEPLPPQF